MYDLYSFWQAYIGNQVLKGIHDLGALGLLVVGEACCDDHHHRQHDTQVELQGLNEYVNTFSLQSTFKHSFHH